MKFILYSHLNDDDELLHTLLCDNHAQLAQMRQHLIVNRYVPDTTLYEASHGFWTCRFAALVAREYRTVPRLPHSKLLKLLGLPQNAGLTQKPDYIMTKQRLTPMTKQRLTSPKRYN